MSVYAGCAGWSLPKKYQKYFPGKGTHLEKYSKSLNAVEINTTFYKLHKDITYAKWASSVPADFRFSVKASREITHDKRLEDTSLVKSFIKSIENLGEKLDVILFQLPPGLEFDENVVKSFFSSLRKIYNGNVVVEARHESWFEESPEELMKEFRISRAAVDPPLFKVDYKPGAWQGFRYFRLHGSPKKYYSRYAEEYIKELSDIIKSYSRESDVWCIFDNTAAGEGVLNALELTRELDILNFRKQKPNPYS